MEEMWMNLLLQAPFFDGQTALLLLLDAVFPFDLFFF